MVERYWSNWNVVDKIGGSMNYIQSQIEVSERLLKSMEVDHAEREAQNIYLAATVESLQKKLKERDETIVKLRARLNAIQSILEA